MKKALETLLQLAIGVALGVCLIKFGGSSSGNSSVNPVVDIILLLVAVVIAIYLQIIVHEAGHLVCGLLTGYRFVSFRIGSITLLKDGNGKLHFKRFKLAGTGGQCLMSPPTNVPLENIPTALYNAGGALTNMLCAIGALLLLKYCGGMHIGLRYFLADTMAIGLVFALLNGIPMKWGGIANDGHNLLYLKRDKQSVKGFATLLIINEKLQNGTRLSQMPDNLFDLGADINYSDPMQANVGLNGISRELDKGNIELAHEQFNEVIQRHGSELLPLYKTEALSELTFTNLATGNYEAARALLADKMLMKYITKHARVMSSKQRVLMAKALLLDNDRAQAERLYNEVIDHRDSYVFQGEVENDIELMKNLLETQNVEQNQVNSSN